MRWTSGEASTSDAKVNLALTRAEAIVLIEFLMRFRDKDRLAVEHEAETQLLYDLCAVVEQSLPELFDPQWRQVVDRSRAAVLADPCEWQLFELRHHPPTGVGVES